MSTNREIAEQIVCKFVRGKHPLETHGEMAEAIEAVLDAKDGEIFTGCVNPDERTPETWRDRYHNAQSALLLSKREHRHAVAALTAAEARREAGPGAGWQTIETAPKDGTWVIVLALRDDGTAWRDVARYAFEGDMSQPAWLGNDDWISCEPTHWMPLPATPLPAQKEAG